MFGFLLFLTPTSQHVESPFLSAQKEWQACTARFSRQHADASNDPHEVSIAKAVTNCHSYYVQAEQALLSDPQFKGLSENQMKSALALMVSDWRLVIAAGLNKLLPR
ncbi:hypothetical protein [Sphingomonas sp. Y38-1Y]|uniref:hypothetical protein n=1 Tax=Sphingomonas sp. Y38-1Y TaxID=3078265 RepID=UPI0028E38A6C|nr:hypothetical protein [Sphingomonas sp. Y38-1Y]